MSNNGKGFGKANAYLAKVTGEDPRVTNAKRLGLDKVPQSVKDRAAEAFDTANFSHADWRFLAQDLACLVTEVVASEYDTLQVVGFSPEWSSEEGVWVGLACWKHQPTGEQLVCVVRQVAEGEPAFQAVECFPAFTDAESLGELTTGVQRVANQTLSKEAAAFSFSYLTEKGERRLLADYSWGQHHAQQKAKALAQHDGNGTVTGPLYLSEHPSTCHALAFSHALNKRVGVAFAGRSYDRLVTQAFRDDKVALSLDR